MQNIVNSKKAFKKLYMFYFETFRIILNPPTVKKLKQLLAMSAVQNHKALWRKKRQCCDAIDVKRKPRPPATSKSFKANAMQGQKPCRECQNKIYVRPQSTKTNRDQQREAIHRPLQAKDANFFWQISATRLQPAPNVHVNTNDKCTKHVST